MPDQSDAALTAVELFKAITLGLGDKGPQDQAGMLQLYDKCLQHVGFSNLNRQNDFSRTTSTAKRSE